MTIFTDFLTYKEGVYHKMDDSFKFNGQHIVKIIGWEKQGEGNDYWIIENFWGPDWGENGYAKILSSDKSTNLDFYAIGVSIYPYTMADYYTMQELQQKQTQETPAGEEQPVDLDQEAATTTE